MKKRTVLALSAFITIGASFTAGVYAQDVIQKVEAYLRPDFKVVLNGQQVNLNAPPLVYDNSSYLPLKLVGQLLGAQVNWDSQSQTIHIVNRIYSEQAETPEEITDEVTMITPRVETVKYLGRTYTLLKIYDNKWTTLYRLSDARKMGIDTKGLRLSKEKYTEDIYVSEEELKKAWKETPEPSYTYDYTSPVPMGQISDLKVIDALNDFAKSVSKYKIGDKEYYTEPILMEPAEKVNQFYYWCRVNGKFSKYVITLIPFSELHGGRLDPNGVQYLPNGYTYKQLEPDDPEYYSY
ncbi:copper amine oxidase N-terminal domain-containing protein [Paenibacillus flagellatus]|nr:copper amine oxidase N-terminal domain-containing protein [Paenibacillus flagellatus]